MNTTRNYVIEFAAFTLGEGVDESVLFTASDALQAEFLSRQSGFIKRELARIAHNQWADVIYWENRQSVRQAMQAAPGNPAALRYFQLMDGTGQGDPSGQLTLMNIARSYP